MKTLFACCTLLVVFCTTVNFRAVRHSEAKAREFIIHPVFGDQPLVLKHKLYISAQGDSAYIDAFRFYISDVCFLSGENVLQKDAAYHLADVADSSSLHISIPGRSEGAAITGIRLTIGVDSLSNVSGAMAGDLDPSKGMYWAWNSGYVNAKLEGRSSACHTLHHAFEFHVGGYRAPYNTRRTVTLAFKKPIAVAGETIHLRADAAAWLGKIRLENLNSVVMPSKEAMMLADQYSRMFSIAL